jgi:hypothetical protein
MGTMKGDHVNVITRWTATTVDGALHIAKYYGVVSKGRIVGYGVDLSTVDNAGTVSWVAKAYQGASSPTSKFPDSRNALLAPSQPAFIHTGTNGGQYLRSLAYRPATMLFVIEDQRGAPQR